MIELGIVLTKHVTIPVVFFYLLGLICKRLGERQKPIGEVEINIKYNDPEEVIIPLCEETKKKIDEIMLGE